ncbi:hypothetical protein IFM89_016313 [Coptis chinensis]|uniref:MADS-box domain-containing protein n=1 Tax=Coptis chinensis TaxID=261450 RepID=A0A835H4T5_9MAGN|nr:hypothetical protein IFM89_016313 [Coptis chinensis]
MGRNAGKISMQPIANNKARRVTFVKRKNGLKKKLHELTTLCDIEACMICFDGDDGTVETWPEDQRKFNGVIQKYKRVGRIEREKNCVNVEGQLEARKKKLEDNCGWDQQLDDLSKESLSELGCSLDCQLEKVRERVHQLNNVSHENSNSVLVDESHPPYFGDNSVMIGSPSNYYYGNQQFTMAECYGTDNDDQTDFSGVAQPIMIQPPPLQQAMPWSQDATMYLYSL